MSASVPLWSPCARNQVTEGLGSEVGHGLFNTYTMSRNAKFSPDLILMRDVIDHFAGQNYRAFDSGAGSYDYKLLFCKDHEPIFDSFIPLTMRGRFAVGAMSAFNGAKQLVKRNPALLDLAQNLRSRFRPARTFQSTSLAFLLQYCCDLTGALGELAH